MPRKPSEFEIKAQEHMKKNPSFSKDVVEAIINDTPELRDALVERHLVEEIKNA